MRIRIASDEAAQAREAADIICDSVRAKPEALLGLPTGKTPMLTYADVTERVQRGEISFERAHAFALDEFAGVSALTSGANSHFYAQHLQIPMRIELPDPMARDLDAEIQRFAGEIDARGGFDLCVLGIGTNGHIAFNEPPAARDSAARIVTLAPSSRAAHAGEFGGIDRVPERGMTLGVADILASRSILVLATGESKANVVRATVEGEPTPEVPASWLQSHDNVTLLLDPRAASLLRG